MKPLGLPFKTPLGYYFYETQRNEILAISKDVYVYLYKLIMDSEELANISSDCSREICELKEYGYLLPSEIKYIEHPQTRTIENMLERKLTMMTMQLTQMCNLRCDYCIYSENSSYNRCHTNNKMSFETAKKLVDFYHAHSMDSEKIAIAFYGGEPLLEFDLIKRIVEYANKVFEGKPILYRMTTNATLFTDDSIEFFFNSGNDFLILISLDGPKSIQDKNRKFPNGGGSYDVIIRNLQKIYDKNPLYMEKLHFNTVIDPQNDYLEIYKILEHPLLKNMNFQFNLLERNSEPVEYEPEYLTQFNYDMFLGYLTFFRDEKKEFPNKMIERNVTFIQDNIRKFRSISLSQISAPGGPCEPGRMRLFANYKGDFFPCERVSELSECMHIGSVDKGFDIKKIKDMLNIAAITEDECKNCWAFHLCSICVKRADKGGVISAEKKLKACASAKRVALDKINQKILTYEDFIHKNKMDRME